MLDAVRTGHTVTAPIHVGFDTPMDAASVAGALRIVPDSAVSVSWDAAGKQLTIAPTAHWQPDTLYTVTIDTSARSEAGGRLGTPVRAVVLTAPAGTATITPTAMLKGRARTDTGFTIKLDRAIPVSAVRAALRIEPTVDGRLEPGASAGEYRFTPAKPLKPATEYRVLLTGLVDGDGLPFSTQPSITVSTVASPSVVRFRPVNRTRQVDRAALLSVRFTQSMDREQTAAAFSVTANGKPVAGTTSWAEKAQVLIFRPSAPLAYGATVVMKVDGTARSRAGVPVEAATSTFRVLPKPAAAPKPRAGDGWLGQREAHADQPFGRWWRRRGQLARRRGVLPASHELHADRRLGDLGRVVLVAGRPEREAARAEREHLGARLAAVREATRDEQPVRPLHRRLARRPACATRVTRATGGPRTSAAGRATRIARSSARTASSRARSPTTVAITATS